MQTPARDERKGWFRVVGSMQRVLVVWLTLLVCTFAAGLFGVAGVAIADADGINWGRLALAAAVGAIAGLVAGGFLARFMLNAADRAGGRGAMPPRVSGEGNDG